MPLIKLSKNFQVTIPVSIRRGFDLKEGDYLEEAVENGVFIFKPVRVIEKVPKPKVTKPKTY